MTTHPMDQQQGPGPTRRDLALATAEALRNYADTLDLTGLRARYRQLRLLRARNVQWWMREAARFIERLEADIDLHDRATRFRIGLPRRRTP